MTESQDFIVSIGDLITSPTAYYEVQNIMGTGISRMVPKCREVAFEIIKNTNIMKAKEEEAILQMLTELNVHKPNNIRCNDSFTYGGQTYEFENLHINLYGFKEKRQKMWLELRELRPLVKQLAIALEFLKGMKWVHGDLKPENIMVEEHSSLPLKIKLMDFGFAIDNPEAWIGRRLQSLWYRSPEVMLGAPFNEAIDVWSLGCIAGEMLQGIPLFPGINEHDVLRHIINTHGNLPDHVLDAGQRTEQFFQAIQSLQQPNTWKFGPTDSEEDIIHTSYTITDLNQFMQEPSAFFEEDACAEQCDKQSFFDLLTKMLMVDASQRITPGEILRHPFITMSHLKDTFNNSQYVNMSMELMGVCQDESSENDVFQFICQSKDSIVSTSSHANEGSTARLNATVHSCLHNSNINSAKKRKRDANSENRELPEGKRKERSPCGHTNRVT